MRRASFKLLIVGSPSENVFIWNTFFFLRSWSTHLWIKSSFESSGDLHLTDNDIPTFHCAGKEMGMSSCEFFCVFFLKLSLHPFHIPSYLHNPAGRELCADGFPVDNVNIMLNCINTLTTLSATTQRCKRSASFSEAFIAQTQAGPQQKDSVILTKFFYTWLLLIFLFLFLSGSLESFTMLYSTYFTSL